MLLFVSVCEERRSQQGKANACEPNMWKERLRADTEGAKGEAFTSFNTVRALRMIH